MTFNELRYIVAVAQERSFGRAAQRCFVSQPALSVAIQKLEEELGAQLFERKQELMTELGVESEGSEEEEEDEKESSGRRGSKAKGSRSPRH